MVRLRTITARWTLLKPPWVASGIKVAFGVLCPDVIGSWPNHADLLLFALTLAKIAGGPIRLYAIYV